MTTFNKIHTAKRGYSTYKAEGFPGVILLAKPAFNGDHPDTIEVANVPAPVAGAGGRVKLTDEQKAERLAARKAKAAAERARLNGLTPAQRAEEKAAWLRQKLADIEKKAAQAPSA